MLVLSLGYVKPMILIFHRFVCNDRLITQTNEFPMYCFASVLFSSVFNSFILHVIQNGTYLVLSKFCPVTLCSNLLLKFRPLKHPYTEENGLLAVKQRALVS